MTVTEPIKLAIVGVGKIARDQHLPSLKANSSYELVAAVSRNATVDGVENFTDINAMLAARQDVAAVALCMPPQARFEAAWASLDAGKHVLLEKPPGATVAEVEALKALASAKGLTLYATWHSRHAPAVAEAKAWLTAREIRSVDIVWKEDVRRWHPGQEWIWEPGGAGIFDPGINALSVLTEIMPHDVHVQSAELDFPEGRQAPIAARLTLRDHLATPIRADFDWRQTGPQTWNITIETDAGAMRLSSGGAVLEIDGQTMSEAPEAEYPTIYARFASLIENGESDVDLRPLVHVADAFMLGRRIVTEPFIS